jgi:copper chaperone
MISGCFFITFHNKIVFNLIDKGDVMKEATLQIEGMSCQHCVMRVKKTIEGLAGISDLSVDVGSARIVFDESKIQQSDIENAIIKAGYKIKG